MQTLHPERRYDHHRSLRPVTRPGLPHVAHLAKNTARILVQMGAVHYWARSQKRSRRAPSTAPQHAGLPLRNQQQEKRPHAVAERARRPQRAPLTNPGSTALTTHQAPQTGLAAMKPGPHRSKPWRLPEPIHVSRVPSPRPNQARREPPRQKLSARNRMATSTRHTFSAPA